VARELGVQWGGAVKLGNNSAYLTGRDNSALGQGIRTKIDPPPATWWTCRATEILGASASSFGFIYQEVGKMLLAAQLTALQDEGKLPSFPAPRSPPWTIKWP